MNNFVSCFVIIYWVINLDLVLVVMGKKSVYAVFRGRKTGVFNSWPECHEQVDGFKGASYQKFHTVDEAYEAIRAVHREELSTHTSGTTKVLCTEPVQNKTVSADIFFHFLFIFVAFVIGVTVGKTL